MDEQVLEAMLAEYAVLSSSFDKHLAVGYSVIPAALTAVGGFVLLAKPGQFTGVAASLVLLVVIAWMGVSHALLSMYGLRLVELELELRDALPASDARQPCFFTRAIGNSFPALGTYIFFFVLVGSAALIVAMIQWWGAMVNDGWPLGWRIAAVAAPVAANALALASVFLVEHRTQEQKAELIARYADA